MATKDTKWIMECQTCPDSLTIIYHPEPGHSQAGAVKAHLAKIMTAHLEDHEEPVPPELKEWIRRVKPYPFNDQGTRGRRARQLRRRRAHERPIHA